MIEKYSYKLEPKLTSEKSELDALRAQYKAADAALKNEGLSDQGKPRKATVEDILSLLVSNKITREAALNEISKITGKSIKDVDSILKVRGL